MFGSKSTPRYWTSASVEANVADFVSVSAPVSEHDTITRAGDYLRVWRLEGVAFEASDVPRSSATAMNRFATCCATCLRRSVPSTRIASSAG